MGSLKKEMISGVVWLSISKYSALIIQFVVTIIISRILSPEDYGIIGFLYVFLAIGSVLVDSGFGQALIQKGDSVSNVDYSSVFYVNVFVGFLFYLILYFAIPFIAGFYETVELEKLGRVVFLIIPITSLGVIHSTMLAKDLKFKKLSIIGLVSGVISGIIGVLLAYRGFGIYSLVLQVMVLNIVRTILLIVTNSWFPSRVFSKKSITDLLPFSLSLLGEGSLIVVFNNIYILIIGKFYNVIDVGYYNQAKRFAELSSTSLTGIIFSVSFPTLAKIKDDLVKLKSAYKRIISMTVFILVPVMFLLIVIGDDLFSLLLTDKWLPAVPYFRLLCLYGVTFPLHQINTNIFKALGKGKKILFIEVLRRVLLIISIICTINLSISYLLIGQIIAMAAITIVNMYFSGKEINYSVFKQVKDISPYYLIGIFTTLIAYNIPFSNNFIIFELVTCSLIFGTIYLFLNRLFKTSAYSEFIEIIKLKAKY